MTFTASDVKNQLLSSVSDLAEASWQYVSQPGDLTRKRKISFNDAIISTISMQKSSSKLEILKYFDFNTSAPTVSALIQQRKKILPEAFEYLFRSFTSAFTKRINQTLKGYARLSYHIRYLNGNYLPLGVIDRNKNHLKQILPF